MIFLPDSGKVAVSKGNGLRAKAGRHVVLVSQALDVLLVFGIVLFVSLLGIFTRPIGFLAVFWPANAVLLGLFLREPRFASYFGWLAAFLGYLAADLSTGGGLGMTVWLTLANMAGVATAFLIVRKLETGISDMYKPLSVLYMFAVCVAASVAAAVVGAGAAPALLNRGIFTGLGFWVTGELLNYMIILPLILTIPREWHRGQKQRKDDTRFSLQFSNHKTHYPLIALVFSVLISIVVDGPGAIMFPVPALLWCALVYSLFTTSLLTALVCSFHLIAISIGWVAVPFSDDFISSTISLRMGVLLIALAPLTVASISATRARLLHSLDQMANYDELTKALSRRAFLTRAPDMAGKLRGIRLPFSVIMLDVDHFKSINDTHGHATGDRVLTALAAQLQRTLRPDDLFSRLGGDEFAIMLPALQRRDAQALAERLCASVESLVIFDENGERLAITISVGVAFHGSNDMKELETLLSNADKALYRAKSAGRNRAVLSEQ